MGWGAIFGWMIIKLVWSATCAPSGNAIWQYTTNIRKEATGCRCVAGQDNCSRYRKACEDIYAKYHQDMKGVSASALILLRSRCKGGGVMNIIWMSLSNRCSRVASMIHLEAVRCDNQFHPSSADGSSVSSCRLPGNVTKTEQWQPVGDSNSVFACIILHPCLEKVKTM